MASTTRLVLTALLAFTASSQAGDTSGPIVDLGYAKYLGSYNQSTGLKTFYGIRFAEAPTGSLRWKAPKPISAISSSTKLIVQNATVPGPICVQGVPYWLAADAGTPTGSEDCLLLNVIQPANISTRAKLPVLVSIHGGGYTVGDASFGMPYAQLAHSNNAFVAVSIQYRLGAYGFLGSSAFESQGGDPNLGLLDQRLALEWVRKYIGAFGGDSEKIVITGGSSGGGSVTNQLILFGGVDNPPFRGAIAQFPWWQQFLRDEQLETQFNHVLEATNCTSLDCLRGVDELTLKNATQQSYVSGYLNKDYGYGTFYYGPYVDGEAIQDLPSREFPEGNFAKVSIVVDHAPYEGASFTNFSLTTTAEEMEDLKIQFPLADAEFEAGLDLLFPQSDFNSTFFRRAAWFGDFIIECPTLYVASSAVAMNLTVYKSVFSAGTETHSAVTYFLTDVTNSTGYNATIAEIVQDWYTSFAIHLDPNAQSWTDIPKPVWPKYSDGEEVMSINYTQIGPVDDIYYDKTKRCQFFFENGRIVQN